MFDGDPVITMQASGKLKDWHIAGAVFLEHVSMWIRYYLLLGVDWTI